MSVKNAAILFSSLFVYLSQHGYAVPPAHTVVVVDRDEFARWLWALIHQYNFHPADMDCHEALEKLGLARRRAVGDSSERGQAWDEEWIYTEDE